MAGRLVVPRGCGSIQLHELAGLRVCDVRSEQCLICWGGVANAWMTLRAETHVMPPSRARTSVMQTTQDESPCQPGRAQRIPFAAKVAGRSTERDCDWLSDRTFGPIPTLRCLGAFAPTPIEMFMKHMDNGDIALAVLNRGAGPAPAQQISLSELGYAPKQAVVVRDVWAKANVSVTAAEGYMTRAIARHETILLRVGVGATPRPTARKPDL